MNRISVLAGRTLALAFAGVMVVGNVLAEKPSWAGEKGERGEKGDKGRRNEQSEGRDSQRGRESRPESRVGHFGDPHRAAVRDYYGGEFQSGRRCPPGLAKKHNGCMPPGQARKWELGRNLSRDVIYYDVPAPLMLQLGRAPSGYRYVRVAGDILLIAIGTALVVDAIQDLGR